MLTDKQKLKLDTCFNKASVSLMTEQEFITKYKGKLPLQIDIKDAAKYLNVKADKAKKYTSSTTYKKPEKE